MANAVSVVGPVCPAQPTFGCEFAIEKVYAVVIPVAGLERRRGGQLAKALITFEGVQEVLLILRRIDLVIVAHPSIAADRSLGRAGPDRRAWRPPWLPAAQGPCARAARGRQAGVRIVYCATILKPIGADVQAAQSRAGHAVADSVLRDELEVAGIVSLVTPGAAGILRAHQPVRDSFPSLERHLETGVLGLPHRQHAVLRHRGIAGGSIRIAPAAEGLLIYSKWSR